MSDPGWCMLCSWNEERACHVKKKVGLNKLQYCFVKVQRMARSTVLEDIFGSYCRGLSLIFVEFTLRCNMIQSRHLHFELGVLN